MLRISLLILVAFGMHLHAQPRKLTKLGEPRPATIAGYERAHCVAITKSMRVCKALSESADEFVVEKDGKRLGSWPASAEMGETGDFEVLRGDLDGDGKAELIVANHDGTSNGMAVSFWSIAIFPDAEFRTFETPLTFSVEEYGSFGTFVPAAGTVNILATSWIWGNDPRGRRGEGLYLVGQWWRYKSGALIPVSRSALGRRYLASFASERGHTMYSDSAPYRWLTHRNAEPINNQFITGAGTNTARGVVEAASATPQIGGLRAITIKFRSEGAQAVSFVYPSDTDGPGVSRYIGDAVSGRVYPDRYLPSDPEKWLIGKRVSLRTYDDKKVEILWLEP